MSRLPLGTRQVVVVGRSDSPDLQEMNRRDVRAATDGGDDVDLIEDDGDHFTVIDPGSDIWVRAADEIVRRLSR